MRPVGTIPAAPVVTEEDCTGRLDRVISEMFWLADHPRDEITDQTIKHHAEDMALAGRALLSKLRKEGRITHERGLYHDQLKGEP